MRVLKWKNWKIMYFEELVKPCCPIVCWYIHASCLLSFFKTNNNNVIVMNIVWTLLTGIWMWNGTHRPKAKKRAGLPSPCQSSTIFSTKPGEKLIFPCHVHLGTPCDLMLQVTVWPFGDQSPRLLCALMELFCCPIISISQRGETGSTPSPGAQAGLGQGHSYTDTKISQKIILNWFTLSLLSHLLHSQ